MTDKEKYLGQLISYIDGGFISNDEIIDSIGNYFSGKEVKEFIEFIEDEYVNDRN